MNLNTIKNLTSKNYMNVFSRRNVCFVKGEGNTLIDTNGKEYIDFVAGIGVNTLGYNHPSLVSAITSQAQTLIHSSNLFYNREQAILSEKLLDGTIFNKLFLVNSGAEANECAFKLVRKYYKLKNLSKPTILTAIGSFHGRTLATLTATGQASHYSQYAPLPQGFRHVPYGDFKALKESITDDVGAVMLECIQSRNSITVAEYEYLINAYAYCRSKGILFLLDEIQTGMGRTGKMFAFEHFGIQPDIITVAKGLGGGVPIGAVFARGDVAKAFNIGDHGSTLSGNQLACASATAVVDELKSGLLEKAEKMGEYLKNKLSFFFKYKFVEEISGMGLLMGIKLSDKINGNFIVATLMNRGILVNVTKKNVIKLTPPLTITEKEIDKLVEELDLIFQNTNI
jgi:predicted acetylornithine/succinylornithine family transaminase